MVKQLEMTGSSPVPVVTLSYISDDPAFCSFLSLLHNLGDPTVIRLVDNGLNGAGG
jgi:hypothetical protein